MRITDPLSGQAASICLIVLSLAACGGTQTDSAGSYPDEAGTPATGQTDNPTTLPSGNPSTELPNSGDGGNSSGGDSGSEGDNESNGGSEGGSGSNGGSEAGSEGSGGNDEEDLAEGSPDKPDSTPVVGESHVDSINQWNESATWTKFESDLELPWKNAGGDWIDANNVEQGDTPFNSISLIDDNQAGPVEIDVTSVIQATGQADFFLRRSGGINFVFNSREATANQPVLIINGTTTIVATADTDLNSTTTRSLGERATIATQEPILIRFDLPEGVTVSRATLRLHSTGSEYGNQTLEVYAPNSALRTIARPSWLKVDPTVIVSFDGNDVLRTDLSVTAQNGIATARLLSPGLTWINSNKIIPNQTAACATVYQRLGADFKPGDGGKHPGFSNTGDAFRDPDVINGVTYPDTGWGGRGPDGVHWSARTGYGGWNDGHVASHTYFYAMEPHDAFGWIDPIGYPFPKGKWTAYVQCLKLNTVSGTKGNVDGKLYYEISGIGPVYSREDIRWRDNDAPESEIREFWINYYCGGLSCGSIADRGTVDFAKAVLTKGLPDMSAVEAEVARLNETYP